jgi:hypothetical protein
MLMPPVVQAPPTAALGKPDIESAKELSPVPVSLGTTGTGKIDEESQKEGSE